MQRYLFIIDNISTWVGKFFGWSILALTLATTYDVAARKFGHPTNWGYDVAYMLYGLLFMMAGAYTLSRNGHVRGDVLYGFFPPRLQAGLDLALYILFFIPGVAALAYAGIAFAQMAWDLKEMSNNAPEIPLYHYKTLIPIAGALVLLQGLAEIVRCVQCLKTGEWPQRAHDVEEVDIEAIKKELHIDDNGVAQGAKS